MFSDYWWDAYLWNIDGIGVWPVWLTLLVITFVLTIQMISSAEKRKRNSMLITGCIIVSLLIPFTGEFSGELAFRQACAKDAGFKVYKKQNIPKSQLLPISSRADAKGKNLKLVYENYGFEINQIWFEKRFLDITTFSKYSPSYKGVEYVTSSIVEKGTREVLSIDKNYYGYPGFMSQTVRMCESVNIRVEEEMNLKRREGGRLILTFGLMGVRYE
jgi:hypothetical protein